MKYLQQNIWASIGLALFVSFAFPAAGTLLSPFVQILFMFMVFLSSINLNVRSILSQVHHPGKTVIALLLIHVVPPLTMLTLKPFVSDDLFLGLILASSAPSGIAVIFLSKMYKGDPSRALVITFLSNFLSPLILPLVVFTFVGRSVHLDILSMSLTLIKLIIIPGLLAQVIAQSHWKARISRNGPVLLTISLMLLIIGIISPVRNYLLDELLTSLLLAGFIGGTIMLLFLLGFHIGSTMEAKISYGIASSFKNFALATILAFSLFNASVALPALVYAVVNSLLLIPLQWYIEGRRIDAV
ncbi:hypothetical protein A3I56_03310 [Candidatus Roizmanbacteria bacterium RIFCSPLOWO2_02_FULL_43_10]|uniref:Bile acid:sodium symporter n=1 Tax=Candidatus Roizmanbacteria bacterium RIFCSPLOWO2_02_FULL_43_10 TaxID=1802078 RepID=A0A1F7JW87_9BACT|nr:MAG: hypothetical protein A3I56_03310 [Candidatus Roizmanbacteria bacterium RIFCSPLOWO2_02_FULL_43_10]